MTQVDIIQRIKQIQVPLKKTIFYKTITMSYGDKTMSYETIAMSSGDIIVSYGSIRHSMCFNPTLGEWPSEWKAVFKSHTGADFGKKEGVISQSASAFTAFVLPATHHLEYWQFDLKTLGRSQLDFSFRETSKNNLKLLI